MAQGALWWGSEGAEDRGLVSKEPIMAILSSASLTAAAQKTYPQNVTRLQGRLSTMALCEAGRDDVIAGITAFLHPSNKYKVGPHGWSSF